jgi:hypothetical protein
MIGYIRATSNLTELILLTDLFLDELQDPGSGAYPRSENKLPGPILRHSRWGDMPPELSFTFDMFGCR